MSSQDQSHFSELPQLVKGGGVSLTGSMGAKGILFLFTLFLAKMLGPGDLGLYFLGITICEFLVLISMLGLQSGVTRYVAIYNEKNDPQRMKGAVLRSASLTLLAGLLSGGILFLSADFVATYIFHKPALGCVLKLFSLSIPFECLMKIFTASTLGLKVMEHTAYIERLAWVGFRFLLATLFIAGLGMGVKGGIWAYVVSSIICAGLALYYTDKLIPLFQKQVTPIFETKGLLRFSIPMLFSSVVHDLMMREDIIMLGLFVSAAQVGIYSVAARVIGLGEVIFQTFRPIFNPIVAEFHAKKEFIKLSHLLKLIIRWDITLAGPIFFCLLMFPEFFLNIFGREFVAGSACLCILVIARIFDSISSYPSSLIFMSGRSCITLINNIIVCTTNAALNYWLIPIYGITGAALATSVSLLLIAIIRISVAYYLMKIQPLSPSLWKPVSAGVISCLVIFILNFFIGNAVNNDFKNNLAILLMSIFMLSYSALIYVFRFNEEELYIGKKIKEKFLATVRQIK